MSFLEFLENNDNKKEEEPVTQNVIQEPESVTQTVIQEEIRESIKPKQRPPRQNKERVVVKKKQGVLTKEEVFEYIKTKSGKWAGFGSLLALITRHKAISTSVLDAIIDIHRNFDERL